MDTTAIRKVRRMEATYRFAYARQFEGHDVKVVTSFYGDETHWQGRVVAVAESASGTIADVIVIRLTGTRTHMAISLATVDTIEEV